MILRRIKGCRVYVCATPEDMEVLLKLHERQWGDE